MMKKRILSFTVLVVLLFSFLFSGCDTNAAKNSADIYCSLIFKSDAQNIQKIGLSDADKDKLIKDYQDKIKSELKKNLLLMGYAASDEQLNSISDAYKEALSKITYETKQISKSGDQAEVEISATNFDIKKIDEKASVAALDETDKMNFANNDEENKKFSEIYLVKLAEELKSAEISSDKASNTFKFKKVNKYWVADDETNFGYKLVRLATSKDNHDLSINEESISPKESAEVFWNLVIKEDSSGMEKLGYSKAFGDRIIKGMNKTDFNDFKKQFSKLGVSLSDIQIQSILDSLRNGMSKTSATFEEVSKANNTAQVKVTSTSLNLNSIVNQVGTTTKNQVISGRITDKQKIMDAFAANLINAINNAQITSDSKSNSFSFTKIGDLWIPSNTKKYVETIGEMSMN